VGGGLAADASSTQRRRSAYISSLGASVRQRAAWCEESQISHLRNLTAWRTPRLTWRETPLGPCKARGGGAAGSGPRVAASRAAIIRVVGFGVSISTASFGARLSDRSTCPRRTPPSPADAWQPPNLLSSSRPTHPPGARETVWDGVRTAVDCCEQPCLSDLLRSSCSLSVGRVRVRACRCRFGRQRAAWCEESRICHLRNLTTRGGGRAARTHARKKRRSRTGRAAHLTRFVWCVPCGRRC
jgi:hypothetical protein